DGERGLEAIRDELKLRFPAVAVSLNDLQQLIADLHSKGLLVSLRPGQGPHVLAQRRDEGRRRRRETLTDLLTLRLPGWEPDRPVRRIDPFVRWMFRPWGVAAAALFVLAAWTLLLVQFDDFRRGLPEFREFFGGKNVLALWVTLAGAKVLHE